jgi:hypothetical protein
MVRRNVITSIVVLALFSGFFPSFGRAGAYPDIEILQQSARSLEFIYRPAGFTLGRESEGPDAFSRIQFDYTTQREITGQPRLPVRMIYFGLPPGSDFEISILDERWDSYADVRLRPYVPESFDSPGGDSPVLSTAALYRGIAQFPDYYVDRLPPGRVRSQDIGGLAVYPLKFYPGERRADILKSITIRIGFTGGDGEAAGTANEGVFDKILSQILLNQQTSRFMRRVPVRHLARPAAGDPFAAAQIWYKLRTGGEGIYRLTFARADSLGLNPAQINDPRQIRVFYGGGKVLPSSMTDTLPALNEIPIFTSGFEDGSWDSEDYLEFYGQDLHRWEIDPATGDFINVLHPFENLNVYWFTPGAELAQPPRRIGIEDASLTGPAAGQIFDVDHWAHHERNLILRVRSDLQVGDYYTWYWQNGRQLSIPAYNAVDAVDGAPAMLRVYTYSFGNPVRLLADGLPVTPLYESRNNDTTVFQLAAYHSGMGLQVSFTSDISSATYLDAYDLRYRRRLALRAGRLLFAAPDSGRAMVFNVADVGTAPVVWDVTDPLTPLILTGVERDGSVARFQADLAEGHRRIFFVADEGIVSSPVSATRRDPERLRTSNHRADFLALGPRLFVDAADEYLRYRENTSNLTTAKIAIEDVYDNFSFGLIDPLAIRWCLKYAFENWQTPAPQYVMLVGDGHNDLANNLGNNAPNFVPPYIAADEPLPSDENFIYFGTRKILSTDPESGVDGYPDMIIGRWPVKNTEQIRTIADKITRYASPSTQGFWRNRISLVADDESTGKCKYDPPNEIHIGGAEYLSSTVIPPQFEQRKIYLTEYPFGATCLTKPEARDAILNLINEGTVLVDYIGHGNPDLWAHERVLVRATDLPKMQNKDRLTVMFTASCSNGFFDDPVNEGLAEEVVRLPGGGAVAAVSATRLVFADANLDLNILFFNLLLGGDVPVLGEALYLAKFLRQFQQDYSCPQPPCERPNDRKYILFGDPAMRLGIPHHRVVIDEIQPDTLPALGVVTVSGHLESGADQTILTEFNGSAEFLVSDALRQRRYQASVNPFVQIEYKLPGGTIFRGETPVVNGEFSFSFIVPKDISYGGTSAKIVGYAYSGATDAGGGVDHISLGGTAPALTDSTGPAIEMLVGDQPLDDGMTLQPGVEIIAALSDTSGINLTGEPGHAITVTFDDRESEKLEVTESFAYDQGDFRRGRVLFSVPADQGDGPLSITVKAWDNANNSAQATASVNVGSAEDFRILEFLNYPNPFTGQTTFYFRTNGVPTKASIEVFTVAGRRIRTFDWAADGQTIWDGTDEVGDRVANGVYLTKLKVFGRAVEAVGSGADKIAERVQKVVLWR